MPDSLSWSGAFQALQVFMVGLVLAWIIAWTVKKILLRVGRGPSSAHVFSRLASWVVGVVFFLASLTVVFPSVKPVDVLGGVTVISIAAGIAFQTVLGNMFSGLVILARDQFRQNDQILLGDISGNIISIGFTSTQIRSFDGHLLIIPNSTMHDEVVTVQTGFKRIRSSVKIELSLDTDLARAREVAERTMVGLPQVSSERDPQAFLTEVTDGSVILSLRFWSAATQMDASGARHEVIQAVVSAFRREGITISEPSIIVHKGE
ncbi:mechanosensitive ion channel family protein [Rothia sp. ZJ1223]|nr:mechanosensitive ion channel domain-containing protein [Rothia sp. ZJ1223]MBM7050710.1 mechanosensitive ion channel [Rothia sp. ZJ1223]